MIGHDPQVITNFVAGTTVGLCECGWETFGYFYPSLPMKMVLDHSAKMKSLKDGAMFEDGCWVVYVDGLRVFECFNEVYARFMYGKMKGGNDG